MKKGYLFSCYFFIPVFVLLGACTLARQNSTGPLATGIPPQNAYEGLVLLDDGEIRHYAPGMYIRSTNRGKTWDTINIANGDFYGKKNPITHEYMRIYAGTNDSVWMARSSGGIDGKWEKQLVDTNGAIMIKPIVYIRNGRRAIAAFHTLARDGSGVYYSDDHGETWKKSNQVNVPPHEATGFHKGRRWNHGAVEPSVVELSDGRLWMLMRTAQDNHYESFSEDGGATWSPATPSRFYGTITMPTLHQLKDGRIILLWSNTTPLPELETKDDYWEDVFTNRDAIHAAISSDDGKTWTGFRELYLNPLRNDSLMATRYGVQGSVDRSVHQSEAVEIAPHQLLISLGQHPAFRQMVIMDIKWLYEKERADDFSEGLRNWSHQKYIKGIQGHAAYNRRPGALLIPHPEQPAKQVMLLKSIADTSLLMQNAGAVFNFPAGKNGEIEFRVKKLPGFTNMMVSLHDRWFNPTDTVAKFYSMFNMQMQDMLSKPGWTTVKMQWHSAGDAQAGHCAVFINGRKFRKLPLLHPSQNGISYIHFILPDAEPGNEGILFESIRAKVE